MSWKALGLAALVPVAISMGGCAGQVTPESCKLNYTATGAAAGAIAGGLLGAGIAAAAHAGGGGIAGAAVGGALLGAAAGAIIGQQRDKACHELAVRQALDKAVAMSPPPPPPSNTNTAAAAPRPQAPQQKPYYESVAWANSVTNTTGTVTPLSQVASADASDQVCMTYSDQRTVDGKSQTVVGKRCRGKDGEWKLVNG